MYGQCFGLAEVSIRLDLQRGKFVHNDLPNNTLIHKLYISHHIQFHTQSSEQMATIEKKITNTLICGMNCILSPLY